MTAESIDFLCRLMIALIWVFVLVGGWRTIRELRATLRQRRRAALSRVSFAEPPATAWPARLSGRAWG